MIDTSTNPQSAPTTSSGEQVGEHPLVSSLKRVQWRPIAPEEPLQCGDMWASTDPNTPERQTGNGEYNLQMQAVSVSAYGLAPNSGRPITNLGNGAYWRPIGLVNLTLKYAGAEGDCSPVTCSSLAIASVMLSKSPGVTTQTLHWRKGITSEAEMRGIAFEAALVEKPGFSVDGILVQILGLNTPDQE